MRTLHWITLALGVVLCDSALCFATPPGGGPGGPPPLTFPYNAGGFVNRQIVASVNLDKFATPDIKVSGTDVEFTITAIAGLYAGPPVFTGNNGWDWP